MSDYDASAITSLRQAFATAAAVDLADVTVSVAAASVLITATIAVEGESASSSVASSLSSALSSASAATSVLGITVEQAPTVAAAQLGGCAPGYLGLAPPWGDVCVSCPAGYACGFNTTVETLAAGLCPSGFYCPMGNASAPLAAPAGYESSGTGFAQAVPCAPGTYAAFNGAGTTACLPCPAGHECHEAATASPSACAAGTYHDAIGAASGQRCVSCPANTYRATTGGTSAAQCTACPAGEIGPIGSIEEAACYPNPLLDAQCSSRGTTAIALVGCGVLLGAGLAMCGWAVMPMLTGGKRKAKGAGPRRKIEPSQKV